MTDAVAEKLVQKVANMLEESADLNLLVRRLPAAQETQNHIHERVDAIHGVLKQIEQRMNLEEQKIDQIGTRIAGLAGDLASAIEAVALSEQDSRRQISAAMARHLSAIRLTQWVIAFLIAAAILLMLLRS